MKRRATVRSREDRAERGSGKRVSREGNVHSRATGRRIRSQNPPFFRTQKRGAFVTCGPPKVALPLASLRLKMALRLHT